VGYLPDELGSVGRMQGVPRRIELTAEQARAFFASPTGILFRRYVAGGIILTAPLLFRIPVFRRHPLIRTLELIGGAALLIKAAEALRDWDANGGQQRIVIDV
jgi:hypothetical protein